MLSSDLQKTAKAGLFELSVLRGISESTVSESNRESTGHSSLDSGATLQGSNWGPVTYLAEWSSLPGLCVLA